MLTHRYQIRESVRLCAAVGLLCAVLSLRSAGPAGAKTWTFDRLDHIGGLPTTVLGHPKLIPTPAGNAVWFNGVDDALFLGEHPLAGASTFTWEAIFRPNSGGSPAQRWFHLAEQDPATGADTGTRLLFEIRVTVANWYLDAYARTPAGNQTLVNPAKLYPLDTWHSVEQVFDGKEYRSYVDGELQGSAPLVFQPQGPGHASIGVRIDRRDFFRGAVLQARFTPRALAPAEFLACPPQLRALSAPVRVRPAVGPRRPPEIPRPAAGRPPESPAR